jgi:hypothetical protein
MGDGNLEPVTRADILTGIGVLPLRPGHPHRAVLPDRDDWPVVEAVCAALIAHEPGGAKPAA